MVQSRHGRKAPSPFCICRSEHKRSIELGGPLWVPALSNQDRHVLLALQPCRIVVAASIDSSGCSTDRFIAL